MEKETGSKIARKVTGNLEETGQEKGTRFNPKKIKKESRTPPFARTETGFLEETGTDGSSRFKGKK